MTSHDDRFVIVFNGEIYNHRELRQQLALRGTALRSKCDTEVLIEMYRWLGPGVTRHLRGMYAFAVWDRFRGELLCARDPFGIKPFYYHIDGDLLRFASEKKALTRGDHLPLTSSLQRVDSNQLRRYLAFQFPPGSETLEREISQLPPGHILVVRDGAVEIERFWQPELRPSSRRSNRSAPKQILRALRNSVGIHLRSDVPLGSFLSGGIDSSLLCALAAEQRPDLQTFTVGFDRDGYSEIDDALFLAERLGLNASAQVITADELADHLPRIAWHLDDPLADPSAVALWFLARQASQHVKVVLSGEGADELFGGYGIYRQPGVVRAASHLPGWIRKGMADVARALPAGLRGRGLLERMATPLDRRYIGNAHIFSDVELDAVVNRGWALPYDRTAGVFADARRRALDDVSTMQLVDLHTWLPGDILTKADRMSMAHSLELRVPFLDTEVWEVASRLSRRDKLSARHGKHALRKAARQVLPASVARRPKRGFPVPTGHLLATDLADWAHDVLTTAGTWWHISHREVIRMLRQHVRGEQDHGRALWALLMFSLWHQIFIEKVYDPVTLGWDRSEPLRPGSPSSARAA